MITLVLGETGAGKTSFVYAKSILEIFNKERLKNSNILVNKLKNGGYFNLELSNDHIVFTETFVESHLFGHKKHITYKCSGKRLGLPNNLVETDFYPPYSYIVIDESQKDFDNRNYANLMDYVKRGWEVNRHMEYDIVFVSQFGNVDKVLRDLANKVLYVFDKHQSLSKGKYKHTQSFWNYYEFKNFEEYQNWKNSGMPKRKSIEFLFDGDIKKCYDDHAYMALWFKDKEKANFTLNRNEKTIKTVESFNHFLEQYKEVNNDVF